MSLTLSMAAFALAASISPGPVNIVALGSGARHGLRASIGHAAGATLGFCLLLVLVGLGVHELLLRWPFRPLPTTIPSWPRQAPAAAGGRG